MKSRSRWGRERQWILDYGVSVPAQGRQGFVQDEEEEGEDQNPDQVEEISLFKQLIATSSVGPDDGPRGVQLVRCIGEEIVSVETKFTYEFSSDLFEPLPGSEVSYEFGKTRTDTISVAETDAKLTIIGPEGEKENIQGDLKTSPLDPRQQAIVSIGDRTLLIRPIGKERSGRLKKYGPILLWSVLCTVGICIIVGLLIGFLSLW